MTPNQREDMRRHLELEECWHPLNRKQDSYDTRLLQWIIGALAVICAVVVIWHQVGLRLGR